MSFQRDNIQSMRFMPDWNPCSGNAVSGLIELCFDIYHMNPHASKWVEVGSYVGESSLIFASFNFVKELHCVDPLIQTQRKDVEVCFKNRLKHYMKYGREKVFFHKIHSSLFSNTIENNSIDVVYIDGDHSYEKVTQDINLWYPKVKENGFLCGHDYKSTHTGVTQAVSNFLATNQQLSCKTYVDTSFLIKKCI